MVAKKKPAKKVKPFKKTKTGKHPGGRPTKYKPEYCQQIIEYFTIEPYRTITEVTTYKDGTTKETEREVANDMRFFEGFARKLDICVSTLYVWKDEHPEFLQAYKKAQEIQESHWKVCSLKNLYAQPFTIFMGKNIFGWRDKQDHEITGKGGGPVELQSSPEDKKLLQSIAKKLFEKADGQ